MSRKSFVCALTFLSPAALDAAGPAALFASQQYVEGQLIVQFREGVVDIPDTDGTTFYLDDVIFSDPADGDVLSGAGVEQFRIIAPYWRNVQDRQYFDIHGNPVDGLVDFKDIYLLILNAATDTHRAYQILDESGIASEVAYNALLEPFQACSPNDYYFEHDVQWSLDNDASFPGSVEDVDVNMPEA